MVRLLRKLHPPRPTLLVVLMACAQSVAGCGAEESSNAPEPEAGAGALGEAGAVHGAAPAAGQAGSSSAGAPAAGAPAAGAPPATSGGTGTSGANAGAEAAGAPIAGAETAGAPAAGRDSGGGGAGTASAGMAGEAQGGLGAGGATETAEGGAQNDTAGVGNAAGAASTTDCATALFCENFETGYGEDSREVGDATRELDPSRGALGTSQSMHIHVDANRRSSAGIEATVSAGRDAWGRAYVMRGPGDDHQSMAAYMKFWSDSDGWPAVRIGTQGGLMANFADFGSGGGNLDKSIEADNTFESNGIAGLYGRESFTPETWVCLEWHLDGQAHQLSIWRDGASYMTNKAPQGENNWMPDIDLMFLGFSAEWDNQPAQDVWWDEIVVASERIGCE